MGKKILTFFLIYFSFSPAFPALSAFPSTNNERTMSEQ